MAKTANKDYTVITFRVSNDEKKLLERGAKLSFITVSSFIRESTLTRAVKLINNHKIKERK